MDFTVLVLTGNSVHPIRFASSLFCCSLEPLLCCETLKSVVEIFCRDAQALFALGGLSLSTEVFCNCEVEKKKRNQNLFFLSYPLPSLTRTVLLSCLCTSLLLPPITCLTLFILHFCSLLLSNAKDYECSLTLPIEWKEVESCFELILSSWKTLHYINYTFIVHF